MIEKREQRVRGDEKKEWMIRGSESELECRCLMSELNKIIVISGE